ncbi:hypothetical protein NDU88_000663 [Pleurodeles waltl]|uniref:Uncharacterized protein n=1 Tax=Pleurodeles waltl TaxID=8319 RepID=A0AAV7V865_PLEWA|nr:hypothetical protein NDU88_000663 [Pleurodeles waltl]
MVRSVVSQMGQLVINGSAEVGEMSVHPKHLGFLKNGPGGQRIRRILTKGTCSVSSADAQGVYKEKGMGLYAQPSTTVDDKHLVLLLPGQILAVKHQAHEVLVNFGKEVCRHESSMGCRRMPAYTRPGSALAHPHLDPNQSSLVLNVETEDVSATRAEQPPPLQGRLDEINLALGQDLQASLKASHDVYTSWRNERGSGSAGDERGRFFKVQRLN